MVQNTESTLPKTNNGHTWREAETQEETHLNQRQCFRCELLVSGRIVQSTNNFLHDGNVQRVSGVTW